MLDKRIGPKINTYPIRTPIQAVKNQDRSLVYMEQVNKSRQMDRKVEAEKARSFFDWKNGVIVGTKV